MLKEQGAYTPGLTELQVMREYDLDKVIKLGSNESPYHPNIKMLGVMQEALININRYPEDGATALTETISLKHGVNTNQILLGNGSSELLDLIVQSHVAPGEQVMVSDYGFSLYKVLCRMARVEAISVAEKDFHIDLEKMQSELTPKTKLIFITNPGNPTGTYLSYQKIQHFLSMIPSDVTVVIDEAYYEYVHVSDYKSALPLLNQYDNVIITRTFSKAYGLAGLRIGYALASQKIIERLKMYRKPFSVNSVAIAAASATLQDEETLSWTVFSNQMELKKAELRLKEMQISFIPSVTNFISINLGGKIERVYQSLLKKGIIARTLKEYGLNHHLRFSLGSAEENSTAFNELMSCL